MKKVQKKKVQKKKIQKKEGIAITELYWSLI